MAPKQGPVDEGDHSPQRGDLGDSLTHTMGTTFVDSTIQQFRDSNFAMSGGGASLESLGFGAGPKIEFHSPSASQDLPLEPHGGNKLLYGQGPHSQIDRAVDRNNPEYQRELEAYNKEMKSHELDANIMGHHPDMDKYPAIKEHQEKVRQMEQQVQIKALQGLTPDERKQLPKDLEQYNKDYERYLATGTLLSQPPEPPPTLQKYFDNVKRETDRATGGG